jgi:hypothetical protein
MAEKKINIVKQNLNISEKEIVGYPWSMFCDFEILLSEIIKNWISNGKFLLHV